MSVVNEGNNISEWHNGQALKMAQHFEIGGDHPPETIPWHGTARFGRGDPRPRLCLTSINTSTNGAIILVVGGGARDQVHFFTNHNEPDASRRSSCLSNAINPMKFRKHESGALLNMEQYWRGKEDVLKHARPKAER